MMNCKKKKKKKNDDLEEVSSEYLLKQGLCNCTIETQSIKLKIQCAG